MYIVEDPDHWYRREGPSPEVVSPEGDSAELIDVMDASSIREIRNSADRGAVTQLYITRDFDSFAANWEAIAARSQVKDAPQVIQYFDDLTEVLSKVRFSLRFSDVMQYQDLINADDECDLSLRVNALELLIAKRKGQSGIPLPALIDKQPVLVAECRNADSPEQIRKTILRELLTSDDFIFALEEPAKVTLEHEAWAIHMGWIRENEKTLSGEQALSYAKATRGAKTEWESYALLSHAQEAAASRSNMLIDTKLEKAKNELSISTELTDLDSDFRSVLVNIASPESYEMAQQLADEKGALRSIDSIDIGIDEIRRHVRESRPKELKENIINNLDQIPLALFSSSPTSGIQTVVDALESDILLSDLDTAIANEESQVNKLITRLEEIEDFIEPVASEEAAKTRSNLTDAREMISALSPTSPESPTDCIELYDDQLDREASLSTQFGETERKIADAVLRVCEDYIRDTYRQWANTDPTSREVAMITDIPTKVEKLLDNHDHILVIVSDGFGLRQWLEATHNNEKISDWAKNGVASNTPMTTIFPSETGAGHYSLFTGQFPIEHGRDDIQKAINPPEGNLFDRARRAGAYTQALSYLHDGAGGFSEVLGSAADNFVHLEGLRAEDAAFQKETVKHIADVVNQYEKSVHFLQHNQIDQLHEGTDHIADSLIPGVADDLATFVKQLTKRLGDNILPILTADHGMVRTANSRKSLTSGEGLNALKNRGEYYQDLGQRVAGLKDNNQQSNSFGKNPENQWFEILPKQTMQELRALTKDKCDGRTLRFKRRYYSEKEDMTATHGAFTFDEMFIPFVEFDTSLIDNELRA
ncbi:alkaline phosphatase family protein [Halogeometricum limi]|uniref:Type I phosphodiesterase / nucleotide pyrophosphatase n=1 Tax=Halogeometricum limi TaxID=555875 RepID=A0A1I6HUX6_9EURY|nr:alkaline phosphatase family protein [Halogeometricum limi]SFR58245.1 Type I phosphodiesterase / nucleotide pyrophosphatase [Halogeometricum limi]